jgi:hypothetical protein
MKLECSIFNKPLVLEKSSGFSCDFQSPISGTLLNATTLPGDAALTISVKQLEPKGGKKVSIDAEHAIRLPIRNMLWNVQADPASNIVLIAIGGEQPDKTKGVIAIGGEQPEEQVTGFKPEIAVGGEWPDLPDTPKIKLQAGDLRWRVQPDASGQFLDVTFHKGPFQHF